MLVERARVIQNLVLPGQDRSKVPVGRTEDSEVQVPMDLASGAEISGHF